MKLYHITTAANARSILEKGFDGPFFSTTKRDLRSWLDAYAADAYAAGKRGNLIILSFEASSVIDRRRVPGESRTEVLVDPSKIKKVKPAFRFPIAKGANIVFEGRKAPLKRGSRKGSSFARN